MHICLFAILALVIKYFLYTFFLKLIVFVAEKVTVNRCCISFIILYI